MEERLLEVERGLEAAPLWVRPMLRPVFNLVRDLVKEVTALRVEVDLLKGGEHGKG